MLCHSSRYLFVHIPKTAGQSIERYLMACLGLPEHAREQVLLGENRDPLRGPPRLSHLKAGEYLSGGHVSAVDFAAYFKFSFVRNPWDRLVSFYKYRGHAYRYDFKTFLFKHLPPPGWTNDSCQIAPQYDFLFQEGRQLVDFVGRFEHLQADFDQVCLAIGLPVGNLPHANKAIKEYSLRTALQWKPRKVLRNLKRIARGGRLVKHSFAHYSEYYDAESQDFVATLYRRDIEAFGYCFATRGPR